MEAMCELAFSDSFVQVVVISSVTQSIWRMDGCHVELAFGKYVSRYFLFIFLAGS